MAGPSAEVVIDSACTAQTLRVARADGRDLGRVFDLRCDWRPRGPTHIDEIIYGRTGLLERVGLREREPDSVAWSAVREVRGRTIVV